VLDQLKARDTIKNVMKLKMELASLNQQSNGFSFSLALRDVRKNIE
jgi:hypothetical protein